MDKKNTGEEIARIDIGPFVLVIADDGFDDYDLTYQVEDMDGGTSGNLTHVLASFRRDCTDDGEFVQRLTGKRPSGSFTTVPKSFKCQKCGLTWPGKDNNGNDVCPKCHGD